MPIFKTKDEDFFKKWSHEMAYVLGFISADGNINIGKRGNKYLEITSTDRDILEKILISFKADHKISARKRKEKWKTAFRIQIGSKIIVDDLKNLGITPKKTFRFKLPEMPTLYFSSFTRGYFDGDGNVWQGLTHKERRTPTLALRTVFTSGNEKFLKILAKKLYENKDIKGFIDYHSRAYRLTYSTRSSLSLYKFMYNNATIYLNRKKVVFERYINAGVV